MARVSSLSQVIISSGMQSTLLLSANHMTYLLRRICVISSSIWWAWHYCPRQSLHTEVLIYPVWARRTVQNRTARQCLIIILQSTEKVTVLWRRTFIRTARALQFFLFNCESNEESSQVRTEQSTEHLKKIKTSVPFVRRVCVCVCVCVRACLLGLIWCVTQPTAEAEAGVGGKTKREEVEKGTSAGGSQKMWKQSLTKLVQRAFLFFLLFFFKHSLIPT